ncbi:CDP-diacylglycerol--inositol 3-phosphatidyltransferase-like [Varroa jacobsoni]|uniref:CDP-diacylglycerol--inositol 3-phosphatidyltransferase n=1 Tax=Varroa destructor TaxID=109461 RepID=A0A7M7JHL5_VARDE|nr:CDP-diacylglycerol--inositol 3-phosphatidyltransferase-like [Varroa destructor]XP_022707484.1 CDP-diacylglycerol--inositol 3-phosphatidyltransferase-like [Varroa jacobsoni]
MVEPGENIFLFIPNLIGYGRILLALLSFYWMPTDYSRAFWCYALSAFLDAWDGHAARYFRQSTKFGALLDQLTDRCGTMCLLVTLSYFYPKYMFCFQVSMSIDIASHWLHTQVSLMMGKTSHKDVKGNALLHFYYTSKPFLFTMCVANEVFYLALYMVHFVEGPKMGPLPVSFFRLCAYITFPLAILKSVLALIQMYEAAKDCGRIDEEERAKNR